MYKRMKNENISCFLFAFVCTFLVFLIFLGQGVFSDVITFAKQSDADKLCYASFMKIRELIITGENIIGVDSASFNGATEFFLRPNLPCAYIWFYVFAIISIIVPPRIMYILFYACHMIVGLFFIQKLCRKYFRLDDTVSMVVASMFLYLLCVESWYLSFYIITVLSVILFYASLELFYYPSIKSFIWLIFCAIISLTSGYVTISCFLLICIYFISILYILSDIDKKFNKKIIILTTAYVCGGLVCLPYLYQVLLYVKEVVGSNTNLSDVVAYELKLNDMMSVLSAFSFTSSSEIEGVATFSLGFITCTVFAYAISDRVFERIASKDKLFVISNLAISSFIIIWTTESSTAVTGWMYSLLPVLGGMHLPHRYMMITLPFLYISIGILCNYIEWDKKTESLKVLAKVIAVLVFAYVLALKFNCKISFINENHFVIECFLLIIFLVIKSERKNRGAYLIWCISLIIMGTTYFYNENSVYKSKAEIEKSSIIYSKDIITAIDNYIESSSDAPKKVYRIVGYDSFESVPSYLLSNYGWYGYSRYSLCNYGGYELHLCLPKDYNKMMPWFNNFDWEYLKNTRADYFMTDYKTIDENKEFFDSIINWDKGVADIGNGRIMVSLNKYIPSTICGDENALDDNQSFDNGIFYSKDLLWDNIAEFDTDENSYYKLVFNSESDSNIALLPYANRFYHYYVDGEEVMPKIEDMQAIVEISSGTHTLEIVYENRMGALGLYLIIDICLLMVFILILINIISFLVLKKRGKR